MSNGRAHAGCVLLPMFLGLAVFVFIEVDPSHVAAAKDPSWLDNVFGNALVLAVIRLGLVIGVAYLAVSVVGLVSEGRWLSELGPAKAAKARAPFEQMGAASERLKTDLKDAQMTIGNLEERLEESDRDLAGARSDIEFLIDHIDMLEESKEGTDD